jgi:hypothetical protein
VGMTPPHIDLYIGAEAKNEGNGSALHPDKRNARGTECMGFIAKKEKER